MDHLLPVKSRSKKIKKATFHPHEFSLKGEKAAFIANFLS